MTWVSIARKPEEIARRALRRDGHGCALVRRRRSEVSGHDDWLRVAGRRRSPPDIKHGARRRGRRELNRVVQVGQVAPEFFGGDLRIASRRKHRCDVGVKLGFRTGRSCRKHGASGIARQRGHPPKPNGSFRPHPTRAEKQLPARSPIAISRLRAAGAIA